MRLVDFLTQLLEAHAHTLQRLAALLGEDVLMELLELAGEEEDKAGDATLHFPPLRIPLLPAKWQTPGAGYAALEGAVHDFKLPPVLAFYLWAYPTYRGIIESGAELESLIQIPTGNSEPIPEFVEQAIQQAKTWTKRLPFPPDLGRQAEAAAEVPWRRFRVSILKQLGKRPLERIW